MYVCVCLGGGVESHWDEKVLLLSGMCVCVWGGG